MRSLLLRAVFTFLATSVIGEIVHQPLGQDPLLSTLDSTKVPGKSPVEICSLSPSDDLVEIKYIDLNPNPPVAGQSLNIDAMGYLKTTIEEGAYANFEVKYGFIKLLTGTADLCEQATQVNLTCPIEKGKVNVQKLVELPSQIPPGKYQVTANVFTSQDELVTCLTATVFFKVARPWF